MCTLLAPLRLLRETSGMYVYAIVFLEKSRYMSVCTASEPVGLYAKPVGFSADPRSSRVFLLLLQLVDHLLDELGTRLLTDVDAGRHYDAILHRQVIGIL